MEESLHVLMEQRRAKLASLRTKGIDPFANKFTPSDGCGQARSNYTEGRVVSIAGRITAHRDMGKSMFIDLKDQSGRIQAYAQKNVLGDDQFEIFKHLDLGDFIGATGAMFTTKTGEISVKLQSFVILTKALRPPPAKWHGLEDTEIRYRQRYLDLMANDEVKSVFLKRSAILREIRNFMHARGYLEVETPMMQAIPGGAAAKPFAGAPASALRITAGHDAVLRFGEGEEHHVSCRKCGSLLYSRVRGGAYVHVSLGALVDPPTITPAAHIFVGSKAPWEVIRDGLPQFDAFPPG